MKYQEVYRALALQQQIRQLDKFIGVALRVWTGKLILRKRWRWLVKTTAYGAFSETELELPTELKRKVLDVVIEYQTQLIREFESL